jgi:GTP-binding protein EngB required for normal cell division
MRLLLIVVCVFYSVGRPLVYSVKEFLDSVSNETLSASEKRNLMLELDREKTFRIMACGVTGHGKSTLLNGVVGRQTFKQGHGTTSETSEVKEYREHHENSSIVILDTPGFNDTKNDEKKYLKEIRAKCKKVDTLLYCVSMAECRITQATKTQLSSTVSKLKKALSKKIWKSCVVALTFANQALSRFEDDSDVNIRVEFNLIVDEWKSEIQKIFRTANIDNYKEIPIVTAGKANKPKLLPDDEKPWLSILWTTIYDKSPDDGRAVLFHFNAQRLSDGDVSSAEDSTNSIYKQPIVVDESFKEKLKSKSISIAAALGAGGAAGATGATIGATIGALAIGIPSFGTAAGVGLLLGGLIGGGIGVGVGIAAGKIAEHVKEKKGSKPAEKETKF